MNTIAMGAVRNQSSAAARMTLLASAGLGSPSRRAPAEWFPAPSTDWPSTRTKRAAASADVRRTGFIPQAAFDCALEKAMFALLAVAAIVAIGYGFSWILDLVQHWAAFNTGIAAVLP